MNAIDRERRVQLAATLAPLGEPPPALAWISEQGFAAVQLSAAQPGMRPRELDTGARRALRELLRRLELAVSGIDLWIPPEHFANQRDVARAIDAFRDTVDFAESIGRPPLSCMLPSRDSAAEVRSVLLDEADRRGVRIADFAEGAVAEGPVDLGLDIAAVLAQGGSPLEALARTGSALGAVRLGMPTPTGSRMPFSTDGPGIAALVEVRRALQIGSFRGHPVADARNWPDPREGLRSTRDAWNAAATVQEEAR